MVIPLAACSVSEPLTLQNVRGVLQADQANVLEAAQATVAFAPSDENEPADRAAFGTALVDAFAARGVALDPESSLIADYGFSVKPASVGVQNPASDQDGSDDDPTWLDAPRDAHWLDGCEALEMRGALVLTDRASGNTIYAGRARATECSFDDEARRQMADRLVTDYLAQN